MKRILLSIFVVMLGTFALYAQNTAADISKSYKGDLYVALGEEVDPDEVPPIPQQSIEIAVSTVNADNVDFALHNFAFSGMVLGDINLPNIAVRQEADGRIVFGANNPVTLSFLEGMITATASLNSEKSYIKDGTLYAKIDVIWTNGDDMPINVLFIGGEYTPIFQLRNSGFEDWSNDNEPAYWHSFASAGGDAAWAAGITKKNTTKVEGRISGSAVQIVSKDLGLAKANGNVTTGRINMGSANATDPSNYNYTDTQSEFNSPFDGMPDSVRLYAKFTRGGSDNNAQGNFIIHGDYNYKDPMPAAEADEAAPYLVATGTVSITPSDAWTAFSAPMVYADNEYSNNHYMLASFTTNPLQGGSAGDILQVDDVSFVYIPMLDSVYLDGKRYTSFKKTKDTYYIYNNYSPDAMAFFADGRAATVETNYEEREDGYGWLTVTVKGGDYAVNPENVHTYMFRFNAPSAYLSEIKVDGVLVKNFEPGIFTYNCEDVPFDASRIGMKCSDSKADIVKDYDFATACYTIKVKASDAEGTTNTYTVQFKKEAVLLTDNYQLPNSDFEEEWIVRKKMTNASLKHSEESPLYWNSFGRAVGSASGLAFLLANQTGTVKQVTGYDGEGYAATIVSRKNLMGTTSNGNLTSGIIHMGSGTASDSTNYNFTSLSEGYGRCHFVGIPDSVSAYYRFVPVADTTGNASATFVLHGETEYKDPSAIMKEDAQKFMVAKAQTLIAPTAEWTRMATAFTYNGDKDTEAGKRYMLASFSTNEKPGIGSAGDSLSIDHIRMVYNARLASLSVNGVPVEGFDKYDVAYAILENYVPGTTVVEAVADGRSARVEQSYDPATKRLTILVKGGDYEVNPENVNAYVIAFETPDGIQQTLKDNRPVTVYTVDGMAVRRNVAAKDALRGLAAGVYVVNGVKYEVR